MTDLCHSHKRKLRANRGVNLGSTSVSSWTVTIPNLYDWPHSRVGNTRLHICGWLDGRGSWWSQGFGRVWDRPLNESKSFLLTSIPKGLTVETKKREFPISAFQRTEGLVTVAAAYCKGAGKCKTAVRRARGRSLDYGPWSFAGNRSFTTLWKGASHDTFTALHTGIHVVF